MILYISNHGYSIHIEELYRKKSMSQDQTFSFLNSENSILLYSLYFDIKILRRKPLVRGRQMEAAVLCNCH